MVSREASDVPLRSICVEGNVLSFPPPRVMGILNLTPDSFYDGGVIQTDKQILALAEKHLVEGAAILDVGGHSSRPGASPVSEAEEIRRVRPISLIKKNFPQAILSIDTFRASVAKVAWQEGASIINDISGGNMDATMFPWVTMQRLPYILTHVRGDFTTMHQPVVYQDVVREVFDFLQEKITQLRAKGVSDIIADVGFGFSKDVAQNYSLLRNLSFFSALQVPLLVGLSRKSMVYKPLGITPSQARTATAALHMVALCEGASLLRVHDVKDAVELITLHKQMFSH